GQLHLANFRAEVAEGSDRRRDAALRALADLVVGLVEMMDHADLEALDGAAELSGIVRDRTRGARRIARVMAGEGLQQPRAIRGGPRHRADMIEAERLRRDPGAADRSIG